MKVISSLSWTLLSSLLTANKSRLSLRSSIGNSEAGRGGHVGTDSAEIWCTEINLKQTPTERPSMRLWCRYNPSLCHSNLECFYTHSSAKRSIQSNCKSLGRGLLPRRYRGYSVHTCFTRESSNSRSLRSVPRKGGNISCRRYSLPRSLSSMSKRGCSKREPESKEGGWLPKSSLFRDSTGKWGIKEDRSRHIIDLRKYYWQSKRAGKHERSLIPLLKKFKTTSIKMIYTRNKGWRVFSCAYLSQWFHINFGFQRITVCCTIWNSFNIELLHRTLTSKLNRR